MEYVRQTIDGDKLAVLFNLPASLRGREVEVIIRPLPETRESKQNNGASYCCLNKYADKSLIPKEADAWKLAAVEKYADD